MSIEKSEIKTILGVYDSDNLKESQFQKADHPSIQAVKTLLKDVEAGSLSEQQQFDLVRCFINNPVTPGEASEKAYHSLLERLRIKLYEAGKIRRGIRSADDPRIKDKETITQLAGCLRLLQEKKSLNLETFNALITSPNPGMLYAKLNEPEITQEKTQAIMSNSIPKLNADSIFDVLTPDVKRYLFSVLSAEDQLSLSRTNRMFSTIFMGQLAKQGLNLNKLIHEAKKEYRDFFNQVLRAQPQEIEALLKSKPKIVKPEDVSITKCLIHVVKGEIEAAEKMIEADPGLLMRKGQVMDFSERTFVGEGITLFQYALAAQDKPMQKMLLKHFPRTEEGKAAVAWQYAETAEMLQNEQAENHQAMKDLNASINEGHTKVDAYIQKYGKMDDDEFAKHAEEARKFWCEEVGGAYRKQPAWLIETMCEEGENGAWVEKDLTKDVKRDSAHVVWLCDTKYSGGPCGGMWAPVRGGAESVGGARPVGAALVGGGRVLGARHDLEVLALCQSARPGELPPLESLYSDDVSRSMLQSGPGRK